MSIMAILNFKPEDGTSFANIDEIMEKTQKCMHDKLGFEYGSY